MGAYQSNLEHIAEPQTPQQRADAESVTIQDYEALWFSDALRDFAHYGEHDHDDQSGIAVGLASFIDKKVRDEGVSHVTLYTHTDVAGETLLDALYHYRERTEDTPMDVFRSLEDAFATLFAAYLTEDLMEEELKGEDES